MIKFGRVPFRVKENSVQIKGVDLHESFGLDGENAELTIEKNLTDVDSVDMELDMAKIVGDNESMKSQTFFG